MLSTIRQKLKGWKTVLANSVVGIPSTLYYLWMEFSGVDFTPLIPAKYVALFLLIYSVIGIILRIITTGPIGSKGDEKPAADAKAGD